MLLKLKEGIPMTEHEKKHLRFSRIQDENHRIRKIRDEMEKQYIRLVCQNKISEAKILLESMPEYIEY